MRRPLFLLLRYFVSPSFNLLLWCLVQGQVCLRISNHKGWSVIGSALVLYLPSLALASEAVVAEVELELRAPGESPNPKKEDSYNLISYSLSLSLLNFKEEQGKKKSIPLAPKLFE
nr:hypothetical protein CFP56_76762 [Quercus suber]